MPVLTSACGTSVERFRGRSGDLLVGLLALAVQGLRVEPVEHRDTVPRATGYLHWLTLPPAALGTGSRSDHPRMRGEQPPNHAPP